MNLHIALCAVALAACATANQTSHRFVPTENDYHSSPHERATLAYADSDLAHAPPMLFVGVLEFQMPYTDRSQTVEQFVDNVERLGGSLGCDVLFQRDFFQAGWRYAPIRWNKLWLRESSRTWQFLCGIEGATPAEQRRSIRNASIMAVTMRDEVLGQVCERRTPPLGSHVVRSNVCGDDR